MKVLFLGKDKRIVIKALKYLINKKFEIVAVTGINSNVDIIEISRKYRIPLISDSQLSANKYADIDLIISYLYPKKINKLIIDSARIGCINFHPAPLPDFRGVCGYSFGIFEGVEKWGVSAHFVDSNFDTGDIIKVKKFPIISNKETAFSLEKKSQLELIRLFKEIIELIILSKPLPRTPQKNGRYFSKIDFEDLRYVKNTDSPEIIEKKIRACWFPPYPGAYVKISQKEFTLINNKILKSLNMLSS